MERSYAVVWEATRAFYVFGKDIVIRVDFAMLTFGVRMNDVLDVAEKKTQGSEFILQVDWYVLARTIDAGNSIARSVTDFIRSVVAVNANEYSPVYPVRMVSRVKAKG